MSGVEVLLEILPITILFRAIVATERVRMSLRSQMNFQEFFGCLHLMTVWTWESVIFRLVRIISRLRSKDFTTVLAPKSMVLLHVFSKIWIVVPCNAQGRTILATMFSLLMIGTTLLSQENTLTVGARNAMMILIVATLLHLQNQLLIAVLATIAMLLLIVQFRG